MTHSKEKHKSTENAPEKDLIADLLDKDFKKAILKMSKELKEEGENIKEMIDDQNRNISKEIKILRRNQKRNPGAEK